MHARTLPRHARTGLLALGWRKPRPGEDGPQPIWPILGGAPDDGGDGDGGGDGDDQGGDGDGSGTDDGGGDQGGDGEQNTEVEKWKAQARKHEKRAKENAAAARELERLKREGMSEVDKKVDEAVAAARAEERAKSGARVARSAFLAAAKGRIADAAEVVEDLNLRRYVDEEGEVDEDAIAALVDKLAPKQSGTDDEEDDDQGERDTRRRRRPGSGYQGARNGSGRNKTRRGDVNPSELFEDLLGRKPRTSSTS